MTKFVAERVPRKALSAREPREWFYIYDVSLGRGQESFGESKEVAMVDANYLDLFMRALNNELHPLLKIDGMTGEVSRVA